MYIFLIPRNKARPVKNTENVQAAEHKEDRNAAVMSYSSLETNRTQFDLPNRATFNTFQSPNTRVNSPPPPPPSQIATNNNNYNSGVRSPGKSDKKT
jgi:hypothetical protein